MKSIVEITPVDASRQSRVETQPDAANEGPAPSVMRTDSWTCSTKTNQLGAIGLPHAAPAQQQLQQQQQHTVVTGPSKDSPLVKPSWKRWVILLLFCLNSGNKSFQWMQIPSSTTKATVLYDVDHYVINFISAVFMMSFLILSWPACLFIKRIGLRMAVLIASFGTAVGAIIKLYSCHEEGIAWLLFGQILVSLSEQFIFSTPSRIAAVWFPDHQVSMALSIMILGNQFGMSLGFLVPQWYLEGTTSKDEIADGFYAMFLVTACFSVFIYVMGFFLFDEQPACAPGLARLKQSALERQQHQESIVSQLKSLFVQIGALIRMRKVMLLAFSYGVNMGTSYTISTLLNQQIEPIWPDDDLIVGETGFIIIVAGALGLPFWGVILDKLHKYKLINMLLIVSTILSVALYSVFVDYLRLPYGIYVSAGLIGLFQTGYMAGGLEHAIEITYPAPELVTSSLVNVIPQFFGVLFIFVGSYIVDTFGSFKLNVFYLVVLSVSLLLLACSRERLQRQSAIASGKEGAKPVEAA